ncbi:hypothetical protein GOP47_0026592 [Adiantum capillus-veneris]|nr:hypothetical protein GOP47_0026592 [Adiantum capillus-veneris]
MADGKLMQALQYSSYGGGPSALKHVEIPVPTPKTGEVLVKLEAASVNPVDWKIQSGIARPFLPSKFPYIPGTDIAGEVVSLGQGVNGYSAGDKVISWLDLRSGGSFAEYAVASVKYTVKRPPEVSAIDGSCLPVAGLTALQSIRDTAGVKLDGSSNANLLITAASGGVGLYAVQIAKLGGAHVTATCGARNIELDLAFLANLAKEGKLKTVVDSQHPLSKAEGAWARSKEGHATGKVVVTFDG